MAAVDQEAQVPSSVGGGSAMTSPLLYSPHKLQSPAAAWWNEAASRQSTAASASDVRPLLPPPGFPALQGRLEQLKAQRSWRYQLAESLPTIVALLAGVVMGSGAVVALPAVTGTAGTQAQPPAAQAAPYALATPPQQVPLAYVASPALNNSCLIPNLAIPDGPRTFDACGFVVKSTDEVWNLRGNVDAAIDKYFHEDYVDAGSWGRRLVGKKALRDAVLSEMRAFPDIRIHITDCVCRGNDNDGYKCAMPDVLTGTNTGPSAYGPATGRYARWTGMVQSLVKRNEKTGQWQYVAEWGVHDEWALIQQLGLDFDRVPRPAMNTEPLHDCAPLLRFGPEPQMDAEDTAIQQAHVRSKTLLARQ